MKKNAMLKIAAILMVAVLLTTCAISSTFAKYVSNDEGSDDARVARWGVKVDVTADAFADKYINGETKAISIDGEDIVAPGTAKNDAVKIKISGKPEVSAKISVTDGVVNETSKLKETQDFIVLDNAEWTIPATSGTEVYCPLVFVVNNQEYSNVADAEALATTVNGAIAQIVNGWTVTPNQQIGTNDYELTIGWYWAFDGNDTKDTLLGNKAAGDATVDPVVDPVDITIDFRFDVVVEQTGPAVAGAITK